MASADEILEFWLGPEQERDRVPESVTRRWWRKSAELDAEIRERFGDDVERAGRGELDSWLQTPRGRLAVVILLDQFTRNIHRDSGAMYDHDAAALRIAEEGIERGDDRALRMHERQFLYMPLMHAESPPAQERCCELFEQLASEAPWLDVRDFAVRHRDIVARFGRFPHRNELLGRETTPDEAEFLKQPGSSF
ncbi:MAG: DUF924 family protein [Myxococcales bacterium]|jgi:uncharacterized protein (DUF924 family)